MGVGEDIRAMLDAVEARDSVRLTPVERMLLSTDGTVTHTLEALTRTDVEVRIHNRETNGSTLEREVSLRRGSDGSPLAWAESHVNLTPLSIEMEDELVNGDIGIGDLLRDQYAETRREITSMGSEYSDSAAFPTFIDAASLLYLRRSYNVYSDETRIMTIAEWFPKGLF